MIAAAFARESRTPRLERAVFGTVTPAEIVALLESFCRRWLGSGISGYEFFASSVASVHGVQLLDRRRVVIKASAGTSAEHLRAVQRVQRHLAGTGCPSPRPLLGPTPLAQGTAVVETLLDEGAWADPHDPRIRREMATTLARVVDTCSQLDRVDGLQSLRAAARRLWANPHDLRFDFAGSARGAEWIDRLAVAANARLDQLSGDAEVIGHGDYRAEHLRFSAGAVSAIYDWESLGSAPEPVIVANAAYAFTADWTRPHHRSVPTLEESRAFIADYQLARGSSFSLREHQMTDAAIVAALAYGARCQHSDRVTSYGTERPRTVAASEPPGGYIARLASDGTTLLRQAGVDLP
jgi:hypothetical protein